MLTRTRPARSAAPQLVSFDGELSDWNAFVAEQHEGTFCHLAGWRDIMTDVLGHECLYTAAVDRSGQIRGILPLVRVKAPILGHHLVSMPFLNSGGPLGDEAATRALSRHALELAAAGDVDMLELRTRHVMASPLRVTTRKITVLLTLPQTADALWESFSSKLRNHIKQPQKAGLVTKFGPSQLDAFYDVFARGMRTLGTPVLPREFFERIATNFRQQVVFAAVYDGDKPLAVGCGFIWNKEFEITWGASLREYNPTAANMLLYWSLMEEMIRRGVRVFNFGRCSPGGGTHRFKRQWGGLDVPLPWLQWSARAESPAATPAPERPIFRLAAALWRHLPLPVTLSIGPMLARHLP